MLRKMKMPATLVALALLSLPTAAQEDQDLWAEVGFPRERSSELGTVLIHAPQIDSWRNFEKVVGSSAIEITPAGSEEKFFGAIGFSAKTEVDLEARVVTVFDTEIDFVNFLSGNEKKEELANIVAGAVNAKPQQLPLDVVLLSLPDEHTATPAVGLNPDPPEIFYASKPSVLVIINGEPLPGRIPDTKLEWIINTNWDLFHDTEKDGWYLRQDNRWLKAKSLDGKWSTVTKLPDDFSKLPDEPNWKEVKAALPPVKQSGSAPQVLVVDKPAELIVTDGKPKYEAVGETGVDWVTNTEANLFRVDDDIYYLASGRWFVTDSLEGKWRAVDELPAGFADIPEDHPRGRVLVSVPGTDEARLAALEAQIPRTADVSKDAGKGIEVLYAGDPKFEPIAETKLFRAVNTHHQVIKYEDQYYLCYKAVWFLSSDPAGPWTVAEFVPGEIYNIPPTDPAYNTTYVKVQESTDSTVTTTYTDGYEGVYTGTSVTVVYGSGWYYPPYWWYYDDWYYPPYYGYPYSYGYGSWYDQKTGMYRQSQAIYGPYGGAGTTSAYNPKTGAYARGEAVWDSNEIAASGYGYNPSTDTGFVTDRYYNDDSNKGWADTVVTRGDEWAAFDTEWNDNRVTSDFETSRGTTGTVTREYDGDSFTGSGTIERGDKSATFQTESTADGSRTTFQGSGGATGEVERSVQDGTLTREGSVTKDGQTREFASETRRTEDGGRTTEFQTDAGGKGKVVSKGGDTAYIGRTAEGDLYAGRDGNVYKREGDSWQKRENNGWSSVERSRSEGYGQYGQQRRDQYGQQRTGQYDRQRSGQYGGYRRADTGRLDRHHNARNRGYRNYGSRQMSRPRGGRARGGRGRRR